MAEKYVFKEYIPVLPELYQKEVEKLSGFIVGDYLIEHIGSTAVPGLGGKGIIDIMIAAPINKMADFSSQVQKAGYVFKPNSGHDHRLFHKQDLPDQVEGSRTYHLHITHPDHEEWINTIAFRDYLRKHPDDVKRYADVKAQAALYSDQDKDRYMAMKSPVIEEILRRALEEYQNVKKS